MKSKNFDILFYVYLSVTVFSYYKGYRYSLLAASGKTDLLAFEVCWSFCCAVNLLLFVRRAVYLRFLHMTMGKVDKLSGRKFEQYLAAQFRHLGYRVKETGGSHDYGADLLLKKRRETIVVQAKRYEKNVGLSAVQEAAGAVACYGADRAMVVTNSRFTKSARTLARQNDVELWGREEIIDKFGIAK